MKERDMPFNSAMARALLNRCKMPMQRTMKPQPKPYSPPRGGDWLAHIQFKTV